MSLVPVNYNLCRDITTYLTWMLDFQILKQNQTKSYTETGTCSLMRQVDAINPTHPLVSMSICINGKEIYHIMLVYHEHFL